LGRRGSGRTLAGLNALQQITQALALLRLAEASLDQRAADQNR
jgi:hypothetical protein